MTVRNHRGKRMDNELSKRYDIDNLASTYFYQLRRHDEHRYVLESFAVPRVVSVLILSRLDYYNSVLAGLPAITTARVIHAVVPTRIASARRSTFS